MRITKKEVIISILIVLILAIVIYSINYFTQEKPQFSSPCGECTEWQNDTCGFGICTSLEMRQSRNCTGEIPDISITPKDDFITNSPPRYSPIDPTCIKRCVFMPTVCNTPPGITLTSPENLATNISLLPELMWQGSDEPEDNQMLTYDIYLDTNPDPQILISENQTDEKYTLQTELSPSTIYYWKVVVKDGFHETESVIWQFTTEQGAISISVSLSDTLANGISWNITTLPAEDVPAGGNNNEGITKYDVNITAIGTNVDLYIKADGDLISIGGDTINLGNEKYNFNLNDNTVPGDERFGLTTSYSLIMNDIADGSTVYLKFYLDAPAGQAPGTYSNFVSFEAVPAGNPPP